MKRSFFATLALVALTLCFTGCGGEESEIPEGYSDSDIGNRTADPVKSPSEGIGETIKPN